jgi:ATP-dependent helicase/nuclease subunit A
MQKKDKLAQEYRRLLYVALTRAEDRLYIGGCRVRKTNKDGNVPDIPDGCWYAMVQAGFKRLEREPGFESFIADPDNDMPGFRLSCPQRAAIKPDAKTIPSSPKAGEDQDWSWMDQTPPEEENPPRPLNPSRPTEAEPAARSPLDFVHDDGTRFRRGNVTHALLQLLPAIDPARRGAAAKTWLARQGLSESLSEGIYNEVFAILDHPDFAALFGPGSMAEVPITGLVNGRLVSGQIDRLLVTDDAVVIVDYKSNRPPPADPKDVPALYRSQLKAYAETLRLLYPDRMIRTYLLWTDGPTMMEIKTT